MPTNLRKSASLPLSIDFLHRLIDKPRIGPNYCECPVLCILTRSPPAIVLHLYTILSIFGQPLTQTSKATHDTSTETHNTLTLTHDDSQHFNSNGDPQQNRLWDPSFYLKPSSSKIFVEDKIIELRREKI
uniref:Uncharacterized protein n=1 Tax=Cucumis melo TaxID=3656 RepID=A0A9I9E6S4_CUCME